MTSGATDVGVIGVGKMGRNHARVYHELPGANLVGVTDEDDERATRVADEYGTSVRSRQSLLEAADAVSIAVPTRFHYSVADAAVAAGVHVLVEKPFVAEPENGRKLIDHADRNDVVVQVGHVERFNPAVRTLRSLIDDYEVIAITARRLGPPVDRQLTDGAVFDLMIHDLDVVRSLMDADVASIKAQRSTSNPYVSAAIAFENDVLGTFTASRVTQKKIRTLSITARECHIQLDYIDQSVTIHRQSLPEYVETNGDVQFRHRNVVERPTVDSGEPLQNQLQSFLQAVTEGNQPAVTGRDGLWAIEVARQVNESASTQEESPPELNAR